MSKKLYLKKQEEQLKDYEDRCKRCGACCGANDADPCANLSKDNLGKYYCLVYENRLGQQRTISGKAFNCVLIRENLKKFNFLNPGCAYNKQRFLENNY